MLAVGTCKACLGGSMHQLQRRFSPDFAFLSLARSVGRSRPLRLQWSQSQGSRKGGGDEGNVSLRRNSSSGEKTSAAFSKGRAGRKFALPSARGLPRMDRCCAQRVIVARPISLRFRAFDVETGWRSTERMGRHSRVIRGPPSRWGHTGILIGSA
jgi:hypothetical protein